ncbi:hypothetical protein GN244_ATG06495 [Phytophthora infestans]|uniref:Uncharacterized protein n=1 Tax=Phytophthora infestans TaxID=4787 RepID=A0A833WGW6_PHYIN|nr:hypothetical protein GN244_ATG06495 [Phytophthora infestans]
MTPTVAIFGAGRAVCWEAMGYGIRPSPSKYGFYPDLASSPVVEEKQKQLLLVEVSPEDEVALASSCTGLVAAPDYEDERF